MSDAQQTFTVYLRGGSFTLSRSQILFVPGNLFDKSFLGDFTEAQSKVLHLDRHPTTFPVILDYLSGYDVFPLADEEWTSSSYDKEKYLRYLANDAEYYGLDVSRTRQAITHLHEAKEEERQLQAQKEETCHKRQLELCLYEGKISHELYMRMEAYKLALPNMHNLLQEGEYVGTVSHR